MAKGFWVKTGVGQIFDDVRNFYVKTGISGWAQVTDAWVKTGLSTWSKFWEALMAPTNTVELLESYTGTDSATLRLQGRNYKWVPTPQTLKYYFRWIPEGGSTYYIGASGSSGDTTTNPATSTILPGTSSYITISPSGSNFELGKTNRYYFEVRATGASGSVYSSISQEDVKIVSPKAPSLSFSVVSSTSVNITITAASSEDFIATNRYILYTYDGTGGFVYSGGGRGGFGATTQIVTRTLTGLVSGRNYTVYVLPVTGSSGTTPSNYSGYPGIEAYLSNVITGSSDPEAFTTISFTKGFPSSSSQGVVRSTSLSWNASTNATRYEIEYEGSNDNFNWTTVQTFGASPYTTSTSQTAQWGSPQPVGGYGYYYFMRARVRASNPDSVITVIGDNGAYRYATGSPPGQPSFGTITTTSTTASIPVTASATQGSNFRYEIMEYQYRTSFGSYPGSWSTQSLSSGSGTISLSGLSASTTYYIKIRNRNYDDEYSAENETTFATSTALTKLSTPTGVNATDTRTDGVNVTWNPVTGAAYYGVWYGAAPGYDALADFGGNRNTSLIVHPTTSYLDTSLANGVTRDYYVQAYRSGDPTGTKSDWGGPDSGTRANVVANLTAPSIFNVVKSGSNYLVYFSGGSGPAYQVWWQTSAGTPTTTSFDASGSSSPITVTNLTASAGSTYYFSARSVSSAGNTGSGPSSTISSWSGQYAYTEPSATPATAPGTPGTPTNGWTGGTSYPFSWSAPGAGTVAGGGAATITGYTMRIYEATSSSGTGSYILTTLSLGSGTSYTYTSPNASLYYAASVAATNSAGLQGSYSGISLYK